MSPLFLFLIAIGLACPMVEGCTMIIVGKKATTDGTAMIAHTDDAGGTATDIRLVHVPAMDHKHGAKRAVYHFLEGYPRVTTHERGPDYAPKEGQDLFRPLGYIPQVRHTYAYFDANYGLTNEVGLSVAESTAGARTAGWPRDVPYGHNLFSIAELSKVALERCDTARCAIQTMGDLAVEHGFFTDFTGTQWHPAFDDSAEVLGVVDRRGEAWVFHVMTGPGNASAVWAAQRVADDQVLAAPNSFVIREMDLNDPERFMGSPNIHSFARQMGWWAPEDGPLDFTAVYGVVNEPAPSVPLYDGRRMWRVYDLVAPSLHLDPRLGYMLLPGRPTYPFSVRPDKRIHARDIMRILRDYYEGTQFNLTSGIAAGPFGSPVRYDGDNGLSGRRGNNGAWERAISVFRAVYSFVMQVTPGLPTAVASTMWFGLDAPHGTVYVPFYCGQQSVPHYYLRGSQSKYDPQSAYWAFNLINNWSNLMWNLIHPEVVEEQQKLEDLGFALQEAVHREARRTKRHGDLLHAVEKMQKAYAEKVIEDWWAFAFHLIGKFNNGYVTVGERRGQMSIPGYPVWWLKAVGYDKWPGDTFLYPSPRPPPPPAATQTAANSGHGANFGKTVLAVLSALGLGAVLYAFTHEARAGYVALP